jgi:multiple sugar transport system ATP-binding protein
MAEVILKNLEKLYEKGVVGIRNVNLKIKDKEFTVLVGPSGCGKSTTLRLVAGLETPTQGEIYIGDRLINNVPPKDRNIAMVFQDYALYPHMSVYDNMSFALRLRRYSKQKIKERVINAARILSLEDLLSRKPRALSGGQRQRVALGRAIVRDPQVFLFDEPLSNLDAKLRGEMRTELKKLHTRLNATTIYVTHDQVEAMTMGDKIVVLNQGEIQQIGDPISLYNHPDNLFVAGFIGAPPMNLFEGKVENGIFKSSGFEMKLNLPTGEIILGVRPEDLRLDEGGALKGVIDVVEPIGNEVFIYLTIGEHPAIIRTSPGKKFRIGDIIPLKFNREKLHIFDKNTGERLE